ncbi:putative ribonuclease H-like domain-containing protein [Tanacetum coccineum]
MTRSSTKELLSPLKNPERVLRSRRKLFDNPSLVETSSPKSVQLSEIEEHIEEEEVTEIMAKTMEQYISKTQENYGSGITRPTINQDTPFEFKGQFLKELHDNTFSGSEHEDANEHMEIVLEIIDLFHIPKVTQDQIMLRAFPVSLTGAASRWLRNQPSGSITIWEILKTKFLNKYCPIAHTVKKIEEINNFQQEPDESLFRTEIKKVNEKVYVAQVRCEQCKGPHNTKDCPQKEKGKTLEEAYYTQFGAPCQPGGQYRAAGPGFYQRNNRNSSYPARRETMEELLAKFMAESAKRHEENSNIIKEIRASTDAEIQNQGASIKTLELQIGQMSKVLQERGFTWVFFLATKDETSGILKSFITEIENLVDKKVKVIRCDNGTEFKNRVMSEFCEKKGIKREYSVARTPQQNGVAERRNRTLIEAARTMLADSKLPTTFWAEAVNTACYVQNRVLVVKPHNKTPYELVRGRTPALSFMRPFGCHVTILNTLDHLGKFDGKSDDGFFVGYSLNSKAFRVYNIRTRKVEESLHIKFLEDKPIIAGTNSNDFAGTEESFGAGYSNKETKSSQDYIVMPLKKNDLLFDSSTKNASDVKPQPSCDIEKKDDEGVSKDSGLDYQERPTNNTQDDNDARPSINTANTNVNTSSSNINIVNLKVTIALIKATYDDLAGYETEVDISNITTTYPISSTPNTGSFILRGFILVVNRTMSSPNHSTSDIEDAFSSMNILNYTSVSSDYFPASLGSNSFNSSKNSNDNMIPPVFSSFYNNTYLKDVQAFHAKELPISSPDPITSPTILTPSPILPPSLLFDPRYFFIPEKKTITT